jgi:hypothetical protein
LQGEALRLAAEAILGQELLAVEPPDLTEPARIDGIGFIIAQRIFHAIEPARDQGIDHRHGITRLCEGGAPVEMEHPGRFQHHEQSLALGHTPLELGQ